MPRHIVEHVGRLAANPRIKTTVIDRDGALAEALRRHNVVADAADVLPAGIRLLAPMWVLSGTPRYERFGPPADWVYLPADGFLPTGSTGLAVTVHDVYKLEEPASGENRLAHYRARARQRLMYERIAREADLVLTVSSFTAERLRTLVGVDPSRIAIVGNGVGDAFWDRQLSKESNSVWDDLKRRLGFEEGRFVLHVGRLTPKKNGPVVREAWKVLASQRRNLRLVVMSDRRGDVEGLPRASITGDLDDLLVANLMRTALCVWVASHYEGFGLPAAEAMAVGAPLLISDIPALRETVGDAGVVVPEGVAPDIASATIAIEQEPGWRDELARKGRAQAEQYRWDRCHERLVKALGC